MATTQLFDRETSPRKPSKDQGAREADRSAGPSRTSGRPDRRSGDENQYFDVNEENLDLMARLTKAIVPATFRNQETGIALGSRECVVLVNQRGEVDEKTSPALAQVRGQKVRAIGESASQLVGKSNDIVSVFPGRIEDPHVLSDYLKLVFPRGHRLQRRRLWASVPTAAGLQQQINLVNCFSSSLGVRETVLVPEILSAAIGCGFPVLRGERGTHQARMVVHIGSTRVAAGVFLDGGLRGLVVQEGSWDRLVREVQETLQFRLGTTLGFNTFYKVVRTLAGSFFERQHGEGSAQKTTTLSHKPAKGRSQHAMLPGGGPRALTKTPQLRSFTEWGLIEYVIEDEAISSAIDVQLNALLFELEKSISKCFSLLRGAGLGEMASDLLFDRIMLSGDIYFDPKACADHFSRLTGFRFETSQGNTVANGLGRILTAGHEAKKRYRELASTIHEQERLLSSSVR